MGITPSLMGALTAHIASVTPPALGAFTRINLDGAAGAPTDSPRSFMYASGDNTKQAVADSRSVGGMFLVTTADAFVAQADNAQALYTDMVMRYMSADGVTIYIYSTVEGGLFKSVNSGVTFGLHTAVRVLHVANDGQHMLGINAGTLSYSTDGGTNWTACTGVPSGWDIDAGSIATCSNNGSKILLRKAGSTDCSVSTNYGATFSIPTTSVDAYVFKIDNNGYIWRFSDAGVLSKFSGGSWADISSGWSIPFAQDMLYEIDCCAGKAAVLSADGRVILSQYKVSIDYGATLVDISALTPATSINGVRFAVSDDGQKLTILCNDSAAETDAAVYVNR